MSHLSSPAVVLRTIEHGDNDIILTAFTLNHGKLTFIAKGAKRSRKRFGGLLEIFSALHLVWAANRKKGLPFLQEVALIDPFDKIRSRYDNTVYASHWCELVYRWMDDGKKQTAIFELLLFALKQLDRQTITPEVLHLIFQLHFLTVNGFQPSLEQCTQCHMAVDRFDQAFVSFDVNKGGIVCGRCHTPDAGRSLSKGTVKQLQWVLNTPLNKLHRIRFSRKSLNESLLILEAFVMHHLGKETKSQRLIKQLAFQTGARKTAPVS